MSRSTLDVSDRIRDLDTRRAWARARAPFWFAAGAVIMALFNAALVVVVLAAVGPLLVMGERRRLR